jgi:hypothetical protein
MLPYFYAPASTRPLAVSRAVQPDAAVPEFLAWAEGADGNTNCAESPDALPV